MTSTFQELEDITDMYIKTPSGVFHNVVSIDIQAGSGAMATCAVGLSAGAMVKQSADSVFSSATKATMPKITLGMPVELHLCIKQRGDILLFNGVVAGQSVQQLVNQNTVGIRHTVHLTMPAALLDSVPPSQTSIVTNVNEELTITQSAFHTMQTYSFAQHIDEELAKQLTVNVGLYTQKIIDGICYTDPEKKNHRNIVAGGSAGIGEVVDTSTCPSMSVAAAAEGSAASAIANKISKFVIDAVIAGKTYWNVFTGVLMEFYLTTVPDMVTGKIKVIPFMPWRKKVSAKLSLKHIIQVARSYTGSGKNSIDAVIVGYSQGISTSLTTPEGTVCYGEGFGADGSPRAITDPKELWSAGTNTPPKKYITTMVPSWVSHFAQPVIKDKAGRQRTKELQDGMCTKLPPTNISGYIAFAMAWASMIARTLFAKHNRAETNTQLNVRLWAWLNMRRHLGHTIKYTEAANSFSTVKEDHTFVGYLSAMSLHISSQGFNININSTLVLSYVRTEKENSILGIGECIYTDNW